MAKTSPRLLCVLQLILLCLSAEKAELLSAKSRSSHQHYSKTSILNFQPAYLKSVGRFSHQNLLPFDSQSSFDQINNTREESNTQQAIMLSNNETIFSTANSQTKLSCEFTIEDYDPFKNPVIWLKSQLGDSKSLNINSNAIIEAPFKSTSRFKVTYHRNHDHHRHNLVISSLKTGDSGNYTCEVRGEGSRVLGKTIKTIIVAEKLESITLQVGNIKKNDEKNENKMTEENENIGVRMRNIEDYINYELPIERRNFRKRSTQLYNDNDTTSVHINSTYHESQTKIITHNTILSQEIFINCRVKGGYPIATVSLWSGPTEITHFSTSERRVSIEGSAPFKQLLLETILMVSGYRVSKDHHNNIIKCKASNEKEIEILTKERNTLKKWKNHDSNKSNKQKSFSFNNTKKHTEIYYNSKNSEYMNKSTELNKWQSRNARELVGAVRLQVEYHPEINCSDALFTQSLVCYQCSVSSRPFPSFIHWSMDEYSKHKMVRSVGEDLYIVENCINLVHIHLVPILTITAKNSVGSSLVELFTKMKQSTWTTFGSGKKASHHRIPEDLPSLSFSIYISPSNLQKFSTFVLVFSRFFNV